MRPPDLKPNLATHRPTYCKVQMRIPFGSSLQRTLTCQQQTPCLCFPTTAAADVKLAPKIIHLTASKTQLSQLKFQTHWEVLAFLLRPDIRSYSRCVKSRDCKILIDLHCTNITVGGDIDCCITLQNEPRLKHLNKILLFLVIHFSKNKYNLFKKSFYLFVFMLVDLICPCRCESSLFLH